MSLEAMMMALAQRAGRIKGTPNYIPEEYETEEPMQQSEQAEKSAQTVGQQIAGMMFPKQGENFKPMGAPVEEVRSWQQPQAQAQPQARTPSASSARDASLLMGDFVPDVVKQQIVAGYQPKEAKTYTLGEGQKVFGNDGRLIAQNEGEDELTGKIRVAKENGFKAGTPEFNQVVYGRPSLDGGGSKEINDIKAREAYVVQQGGDPKTPESQAFIKFAQPLKSEGGIKFTDTDKKQIIEADASYNDARALNGTFDKALELNRKAYSGPLAGVRGDAAAAIGLDAGKATQELSSVLKASALELAQKMKGALSDNDIKFLNSIGGDLSNDPQVRENIILRLQAINQKGAAFYKMQGEQLRGGGYFKQGGGQDGQPQQSQQQPSSQGGLAVGTVKNGYRFKGGSPNDKSNWEAQ
jgi:hypothetical protein